MTPGVLGASTIDAETFSRGLVAGCIAVFVSGVLAVLLRTKRPGVIGVPLAIAACVTLRRQLGAPGLPIAAIGAITAFAAASFYFPRIRERSRWAPVLFVPGAVAMAAAHVDGMTIGTRIGVACGAAITAIAAGDFDRRHSRDGLLIPMFAVTSAAPLLIARGSIAGPAIVASVLPFCILLFPRPQARFGDAGVGAAAGAYWWTIALVANGNGSWVAGSWVALGFIVLEPAARAFLPKALRPNRHNDTDSRWLVLVTAVLAQCAWVAFGAFVTAAQSGVDIALLTMLPAFAVGVFVATAVAPMPRRRKRSSSRSDRLSDEIELR